MIRKTPKIPYEAVDGVLLLDKPTGPTSNTVLQMARRLCRAKKAGHTGTLDPMASGLLPICFGEATKFSSFALDSDKGYLATICLGVTTDTADAEGNIICQQPADHITESMVLSALSGFMGEIEQIPPMYSALKYQGKALYEYARQGVEIERKVRQVTIYDIQCLSIYLPFVDISVRCSKGTYIRTLAADIGEKLGCGAHLTALRRDMTASWQIDQATSFDQMESMSEPREVLLPVDSLVAHLPRLLLSVDQARQLYFGQPLARYEKTENIIGDLIRLYVHDNSEGFIGLGRISDDKTLHSVRLLSRLSEK